MCSRGHDPDGLRRTSGRSARGRTDSKALICIRIGWWIGGLARSLKLSVTSMPRAFAWTGKKKDWQEGVVIRIFKVCGSALFALSAPVWAELVPSFDELDQDGDGFISREEAAVVPGLAAHFPAFDHDGDGRLSRSEYAIVEARPGDPDGESI